MTGYQTMKDPDFGVARRNTLNRDKMTEQSGTIGYMAPEVLKDPSLIHHIKNSFLDNSYPAVAKSGTRSDQLVRSADLDNDITDTELVPAITYEDFDKTMPNSSSDFQAAEDSLMIERINGVASKDDTSCQSVPFEEIM